MKKYLKITLIIIFGLFIGLIIHGLIEILVIFLLINIFKDFFLKISWGTWLLIHHIFTIVVEILGIVLAFWLDKRFISAQRLK